MGKPASKAIFLGLVVLLVVGTTASVRGQEKQQEAPTVSPKVSGPALERSEPSKEPKPELERPTVWGEPTEVRIGIYVVDINEINDAQGNFAGSIYLEAHWDNPTLRHAGPGPLNRAWTEVWTPRLVIANQQQAWRAFPESVEILPSGEVIYRQKFWGQFSENLNLRDFPQDRQKLTIQVVAVGLQQSEVKMVDLKGPRGPLSAIARSFSLPDFDVVSWKAASHPYITVEGQAGTAGYQLEIDVVRRITFFLVKVIIPLCLIVVMSWVPRWVDPREVSANLGISATAFLTLIAYLFAINLVLPRVSYLTRMDRFILLSTLMVFAGLVQTVLSTYLVAHEKVRYAERLDFGSRIVYPILLLLVLAYSFKY